MSNMIRTQIYLEDNITNEIKVIAKSLGISMAEFIRRAVKKELSYSKNLNNFLDEMEPIESFKEIDEIEYVDEIRAKSRILN